MKGEEREGKERLCDGWEGGMQGGERVGVDKGRGKEGAGVQCGEGEGLPAWCSRLVSTIKHNTRNTRKPICFLLKAGTRAFPRC